MATYDRLISPTGKKVIVEAADRDGEGKNIANNYAKQDGNYQTMMVGRASEADEIVSTATIDNADVSCPPITFGIAGGEAEIRNAYDQFERLEGNSIKFNQLYQGTTQNIAVTGMTITLSENNSVITFVGTCGTGATYSITNATHTPAFNFENNHKYLGMFILDGTVDMTSDGSSIRYDAGAVYRSRPFTVSQLNTFNNQLFYDFFTYNQTSPYDVGGLYVAFSNGSVYNLSFKYPMLFDLTAIFGSGNEPSTLEDFKKVFPLQYYPYSAGSILSAKSASLISRGKNQFTELNSFIRVVGGEEYELRGVTAGSLDQYDANKRLLLSTEISDTEDITLEENCAFVKIQATTHDNIMFYLTFDESYNEPYEAYREQTVTLPNIELRSVPDYTNGGDIRDVALQTGGGTRKVDIVDLGTLNWSSLGDDDNKFFYATMPNIKTPQVYNKPNILCSKYEVTGAVGDHVIPDKTITVNYQGNHDIYVKDTSYTDTTTFKTAMSGVYLIYELATPTDIPLSENPGWTEKVYVDNYGTLQFTTNPVQAPQVEQPYFIRYTASLVEFLDSSYDRAEGSANNLVIQKELEENYAKQDGAYENLWAGNLITDTNWKWINDFSFGTGTVDTVFNGEATLYSIRGITEWNGTTPKYVNVVSNKSVLFNLYDPELGYAHVVESDEENNGLCVFGTDVEVGTIMEFSEDSSFSSITEIALTEETNSTGEIYLHCNVPSDGYVRVKNAEPEDLCIANVWGGNRVSYHPAYEEAVIDINSATYFPTGMKGITVNGDNTACYDEIFANRYFARCLANTFGATPTVSYVNATGTYNIYRLSLSNAMNKGACEIGGSTKFAWSDVGTIGTSTPISADTMSLASGYIYFAIAQSEDTTYTYSVDEAVVDAETFASELTAKGALYKLVDTEYVSVTEYEADTTYYYISATNLHGLNGKAINDEIASKTIVYQRYSMDKTVYTGTAISPAKNWTYKMGDFGTEELTLAEGFPVTPRWAVYYPVNVVETVQQLPNNYVSLESAEQMLHQVGELQGFDFDSISVDSETGNMKVNGLVDTKETIHILEGIADFNDYPWTVGSISVALTDKDKAFLWENPNLTQTRIVGLRMNFGYAGYSGIYYGTITAYTGLNCVGYITFYLRQWGRALKMLVGWGGGSSISNLPI